MIEAIARYIVTQRLANNEEFFCVLKHVIQGFSPSNVAEVCSTTKNSVRSYLQRLNEKSSPARALVITKHVLPLVLQLVPTAVVKADSSTICMLCNAEVYGMSQHHIASSHQDAVNYYTMLVVSKLREKILAQS